MDRNLELHRAKLKYLMDTEPDCTCAQIGPDQFSASGCEYHDQQSQWNQAVSMAKYYIDLFTPRRPVADDTDYEYARDLGWYDDERLDSDEEREAA